MKQQPLNDISNFVLNGQHQQRQSIPNKKGHQIQPLRLSVGIVPMKNTGMVASSTADIVGIPQTTKDS